MAFDVHLAEIFVALAVGITILSAPRSLLLEDLPYYIKNLRISHVGIVPSLIEATMGVVQEDEDSGATTTLRYIACGGEKMSDAVRNAFFSPFHFQTLLLTRFWTSGRRTPWFGSPTSMGRLCGLLSPLIALTQPLKARAKSPSGALRA